MSILHNTNACNRFINISLRNRYVYFSIPKVASSTLKKTLGDFEIKNLPKVDLPLHPHYVHSPFVKPYQLSDRHLVYILKDYSFLNLTFVRNPYTRILSAYLDKIMGSRTPKISVLRTLGHSGDDLEIEVSFEQFVDVIVATKTGEKDFHWRPMSYFLDYPYTKLDFIGKLESFDKDLKTLQERLDIDLTKCYQKQNPHNTSAAETLEHFYTPTLKAKIAEHYAEDFELGGYRT